MRGVFFPLVGGGGGERGGYFVSKREIFLPLHDHHHLMAQKTDVGRGRGFDNLVRRGGQPT